MIYSQKDDIEFGTEGRYGVPRRPTGTRLACSIPVVGTLSQSGILSEVRYRGTHIPYSRCITFEYTAIKTVTPKMTEKRRKSTRNRGEPPFKKRAATPPPPPQPQPTAVEREKGLPLKLQESQILPTLTEMQDQSLPDMEYQSITER